MSKLAHTIDHAAHLLPTQGPLQVFVHHNTLHAFEDLSFRDAVLKGAATYGCQPYLTEDRYRHELSRGRILRQDLAAVLLDDLGDEADQLVGSLGTRYHLRLSMLEHPLRWGPDEELRWLIAETDTLVRFGSETPAAMRHQIVERTRRWVMRDLVRPGDGQHQEFDDLFEQFGMSSIEHWPNPKWEALSLHLLWRVCLHGVHGIKAFTPPQTPPLRHRDLVLAATGADADRLVNDVLIRFSAAFLDQGLASWRLPNRDAGYFQSFVRLFRDHRPVDRWLRLLPNELARLSDAATAPLESIDDSLRLLGVPESEQEQFVAQTLLALRGWAGMLWQMETNAEWTARPAPAGTLVGYLAVRLVLERLALAHLATEAGISSSNLQTLREELRRRIPHYRRVSVEQRAFAVFQCAQVLGWDPEMLSRQSKVQWSKVVEETEAFSEIQRRRVYHLAYERRYRNQTLDAFLAVDPSQQPTPEKPRFQVICCLDDREESYRRHLEEIEPACETFGLAGFYGVAMYYRGVADAHYVPLCPIVIKPKHFVQEQVVDSYAESHRRRADTRRLIGRLAHGLHVGSRTVLGGILAAFFGSAASAPLVARVLFPRLTARMRRRFGRFVQPPPITRLSLERTADTPGKAPDQLGYSLAEMIDVAERMLRDAGLTTRFARLVIVTGHGSSSLNNPHEAAYNCGACGGARGGPNARAFAEMANDPRIRTGLAARGIRVPDDCVFIGAYHNTCDESVVYFDRDLLPATHQADFESACQTIDEARARNAHERCRRFSSAELSMSREGALRHVEGRAEDLSQVRPEYCHATNAVCFVGRRLRTRGLYLDRRTFLTSYDPTEDDADATILTRVLQAALPVCAGINLEYYFSSVDTTGYGCGTKLPHNICGLLGVMDGAASDLRTGLSSQMVEIHEPLRCLFVIETSPEKMQRIFDRNPDMARLCVNDWVQLAVIDPASQSVQVFQEGRFSPYHPETAALPVVSSSVDWYRGWRDHLGYARVQAKRESPPAPPRAI